ncbi:MAG TPA: AlpA family transcriptional regulator [Spongiibacteraceae bacterium]|nr:AlpA family transcriptional regulator [Spongiibacteraceae bacterium]
MAPLAGTTILRRPEVERRTGLSRSTIYEKMKAGTFPTAIPLTSLSVGWSEFEIDAWIAERIAERDTGVQQGVAHD